VSLDVRSHRGVRPAEVGDDATVWLKVRSLHVVILGDIEVMSGNGLHIFLAFFYFEVLSYNICSLIGRLRALRHLHVRLPGDDFLDVGRTA